MEVIRRTHRRGTEFAEFGEFLHCRDAEYTEFG